MKFATLCDKAPITMDVAEKNGEREREREEKEVMKAQRHKETHP